jgi:DNA-binding winged helix-turn-helix (wHTH) protein
MARIRPGLLAYRQPDGAEEHLPLNETVITLGRSDTCDLVFPFSTVSRTHARIELEHNRYILFDAGSSNGTFVNGQRIEDHHQLSTNDEIWLGSSDVCLTFSDPEETVDVTLRGGPPPLFIDEGARIVQVYGLPVGLTTLEYDLLAHLARNARRVCTREECFVAVWGQAYDHATCEDALNACIARLRRNLRATAAGAGREPPQLTTIKRIGFRLDSAVVFAYDDESPAALKEQAVGA